MGPLYKPCGTAGGSAIERTSCGSLVPLADAQVVEAVEPEAGVAVQGAVGKPFHDHGHGKDGFAVDHVRPQKRILLDIQGETERFVKRPGRPRRGDGQRIRRVTGQGDDFDRIP
jgi:hypothetical protein